MDALYRMSHAGHRVEADIPILIIYTHAARGGAAIHRAFHTERQGRQSEADSEDSTGSAEDKGLCIAAI